MLARSEQQRRIRFDPRDDLYVPGATKDLRSDTMVASNRPGIDEFSDRVARRARDGQGGLRNRKRQPTSAHLA